MTSIETPVFVLPDRNYADTSDIFREAAYTLMREDNVYDTYLQALIDRETEYPTGLPIPGGVAIPHTSAEHVKHDAFVIARPSTPVQFSLMGGEPKDIVEVSLVVFLALTDSGSHLATLQKLIALLQDEGSRRELKSPDPLRAAAYLRTHIHENEKQ